LLFSEVFMKFTGIIINCIIILLVATASNLFAESDYKTLYKRGVEQNKSGNYKEAISLYSQAIAKKSDSPQLFFVRGRAYRQNEQYEEALRDFDRAIALKPDYAEAYTQRGVLYIGKGDKAKAGADFKKACDMGYSDGCANSKKLAEMSKKR